MCPALCRAIYYGQKVTSPEGFRAVDRWANAGDTLRMEKSSENYGNCSPHLGWRESIRTQEFREGQSLPFKKKANVKKGTQLQKIIRVGGEMERKGERKRGWLTQRTQGLWGIPPGAPQAVRQEFRLESPGNGQQGSQIYILERSLWLWKEVVLEGAKERWE